MLSNWICIADDLINLNSWLAELDILKIIEKFEEIELIWIFHIVYVTFQTVYNPKSQSDESKLFLTYYVVEKFLHKLNRKRIQEECHKPLKNPDLIQHISQFYLERSTMLSFLQQLPKQSTIKSIQWKFILV